MLGEEGMFSESCHDLGGALEWINLTADIREGEVVVFKSRDQRRARSRETGKVNVIRAS